MKRGFKEVVEKHRAHGKKVTAHGQEIVLHPRTQLPTRSDAGSAGYDFYTPVDVTIYPDSQQTIWTNVKAYMQDNEVLMLYIRSSVGIKTGATLANGTGVIDASYFENPSNDGNIGICIRNNTGKTIKFSAGERIAQGIFINYLVADEETVVSKERTGGIGSSGK